MDMYTNPTTPNILYMVAEAPQEADTITLDSMTPEREGTLQHAKGAGEMAGRYRGNIRAFFLAYILNVLVLLTTGEVPCRYLGTVRLP